MRAFLSFYVQQLRINMLITVALGILIFLIGNPPIAVFIQQLSMIFLSLGFLGGLIHFKLRKERQYYFYYNMGLSHLTLVGMTFVVNFLINLIIVLPMLIILS